MCYGDEMEQQSQKMKRERERDKETYRYKHIAINAAIHKDKAIVFQFVVAVAVMYFNYAAAYTCFRIFDAKEHFTFYSCNVSLSSTVFPLSCLSLSLTLFLLSFHSRSHK